MKKRYSQVLIRISLRRPAFYFLLSTFSILLFPVLTLQSCGLDIEDPTPPSPPQWVQKSLPEEWPERGVDAHESGGILLEWQVPTSEEIASYSIFRAEFNNLTESHIEFTLIKKLNVESQESFSYYVDHQINLHTKYYYKLVSIDIANNISEYSDPILYGSLPQISAQYMTPNGFASVLAEGRELNWLFYVNNNMEHYILTIIDQNQNKIVRTIITPDDYIGSTESWIIPDFIQLDYGKVYLWRVDTAAEYLECTETLGSESTWATFLYLGQ